jgi:hypothetical protein
MTLADFETSLSGERPPAGSTPPLAALWWDAAGDWGRAHAIAAHESGGAEAAWVHAYLHRREGDAVNARYWYGRAGRPVSMQPLDAERAAIVAALLDR